MKTVSKLFLTFITLSSIVFEGCMIPSLATEVLSDETVCTDIEQKFSCEAQGTLSETTNENIDFDIDTSDTTGVSDTIVIFDEITVAEEIAGVLEDDISKESTEFFEETTGLSDESEFIEETGKPEETTEFSDDTTLPDEETGDAVDSTEVTEPQDTTEEPPETEATSNNALTNTVTRDDGAWLWPMNSSNIFTDCAGCTNLCHSSNMVIGHNGVDISGSYTDVCAARDGTIYINNNNVNYGRGKLAIIEHEYNSTYSYYSVYQHLATIHTSNGAYIRAGEVFAVSGDTGSASGVHLHFSILIAPKGKGQSLASNVTGIGTIESNGWIYGNTIPSGGGMVVTNPKYPTDSDIASHMTTYDGDYAAFCANPGSVTYVFDKNIVTTESSINSQYKRLIISTGGGTFGDPSGYSIACPFSTSGTYSSTSAIVKTTPRTVVYLNSTGCGVSVNFMGIIVDYVYNSTGALVVPQNGFVIAIGNGHERYSYIQSFVSQIASGTTKYCWMRGAYFSHTGTYNRYGALVGRMYRIKGQDEQVGLSDYIPEKTGYLFCGWRNPADGIIYSPTREVPLVSDVTTIEAVWRKKVVFNLNGGYFTGNTGYGIGSADAVNGAFASNKTIIYAYASTGPLSLYFNSTCTAVAVDCKGSVVDYIYQSTGYIRIPYNGFLIVSGSGSAKYASLSNLVNNMRGGTVYWFWRSGTNIYVTGTHTSYGAFNGYQFAEGNEAAITAFIPVKAGAVFSHWLASDGTVYAPGARVDVSGSHTITLTAVWV